MSKPKVRDSMYKSETSQVVAGLEIGNDELKETRELYFCCTLPECLLACWDGGGVRYQMPNAKAPKWV